LDDKDKQKSISELRKLGLRVTRGIDIRAKQILVRFEVPSQLNNAPMSYYHDISIGMYSYLRSGTARYVKSIGRYCSIGPGVTIGEGEHPTGWLSTSPSQYGVRQFSFYPPELEDAPQRMVKRTAENNDGATGHVVIGNDVWIGGGSTIRRGIRIGVRSSLRMLRLTQSSQDYPLNISGFVSLTRFGRGYWSNVGGGSI